MLKPYYKEGKNIQVCAPRAYFVPFQKGQERSLERENSLRFESLNGVWNIQAYDSPYDADEFWTKTPTAEIPVPSCVQYYGYDYFQYTNIVYPFPFHPPVVPEKNPCYHFSKIFTFEAKPSFERVYLATEGVDSAFYLYVNGQFAGYSQISHKLGEIEITPFLKAGENKIDMLVLKWCFSSYLEDQDKWRFTGIFRDIYLLKRPKTHIQDYAITTTVEDLDGIVTFTPKTDVEVLVTVNGATKKTAGETVEFRIKNAKLWSAETPYLYDLTIEAGEEVIFERVGIRTSEVKNGLYLLNGQPVKFYGVNRHDFHAEKGAAVSLEDMRNDLLLMKKLNVNAVRTSHYPSAPLFYTLCDEMGFYVMSESDLETHGCHSNWKEKNGSWCAAVGTISEDKRFEEAYLERQVFNVENNKNHACVVIWSLGNECGFGQNLLKSLRKIKEIDSRPVHYESFSNYDTDTYTKEEYYSWEFDMVSRMYTDVPWILDTYLPDEKEKRPLVYCEYLHAMGNGPGGFKEYWEVFESTDRIMGGFIWEWADHGVSYGGKTNRYGGDFGEYQHDGNFCMDGIVLADRSLKAGSLQMKKFYQPISFKKEAGKLIVFNKNYFASETGTIRITIDGKQTETSVCIAPREEMEFVCAEEKTMLAEYIRHGESEACAHEQFYVNAYLPTPFKQEKVQYIEQGRFITVCVGANEYKFDRTMGEIIDVKTNGESLGGIQFNVWRAPTDNDRFEKNAWITRQLHVSYPNVLNVEMNEDSLTFEIGVAYARSVYLLTAKITYTFSQNGVEISIEYKQADADREYFRYFPRVGWKMALPKRFEKLKYLAYGKGETYSDMYEYALKEEYTSTVQEEYFHYAKPQESGSHYLPEYAELTDGKTYIRAEGMQSFSALPYEAKTLTSTMHDDELKEEDVNIFSCDYCMSGLGTNSCGPIVKEPYQVPREGKGCIRFFFQNKLSD